MGTGAQNISPSTMGKIIFYEGRNFQGRHWECSSDCMDTYRHFNCCNSIRVSGGHWVGYEKPHYGGYQYVMGPGEYPDYHSWMGYNNCIRSCQIMEGYWIFYEHPNYRGRQYFLRPGEYRACGDWGCHNPMVGSFRRMRMGL